MAFDAHVYDLLWATSTVVPTDDHQGLVRAESADVHLGAGPAQRGPESIGLVCLMGRGSVPCLVDRVLLIRIGAQPRPRIDQIGFYYPADEYYSYQKPGNLSDRGVLNALRDDLRATVLDLPPSVAVGRRIVEEEGYADRVGFDEGDVFHLGLGEGLDVVSAFNLVHHLPVQRNRELCGMARAALRPGGCLVIGDSARPEPGEGVSEHGAVSSLLFYAWSHSRNFKPSEIRAWMEQAGFGSVDVHRNERSPWRVVVVGR